MINTSKVIYNPKTLCALATLVLLFTLVHYWGPRPPIPKQQKQTNIERYVLSVPSPLACRQLSHVLAVRKRAVYQIQGFTLPRLSFCTNLKDKMYHFQC